MPNQFLHLAASVRPSSHVVSPSRAVSAPTRAVSDEFSSWMAKYSPVERAILEAREKRLARKSTRKAEKARQFGDLCEATEGLAKTWRADDLSFDEQIQLAEGDVWTLQCLAAYYGRSATQAIDSLRHRLKRPLYYEQENARRRQLAAERRRIRRRTTTNPCPTKEQILDAWIHLKDSHEATIRFGSLIEDLACYVDSSLRFDENGSICGRRGGVKAWLQENIPALALRYTTVMRYKALAHKLKQIAEIEDPTPAEEIVGGGDLTPTKPIVGGGDQTTGCDRRTKEQNGTNQFQEPWTRLSQSRQDERSRPCSTRLRQTRPQEMETLQQNLTTDENETTLRTNHLPIELVRARAIWREVVTGINPNPTALAARIDALVDPERVEEATMLAEWRERYANEITERTKKRWLKRLCARFGVA